MRTCHKYEIPNILWIYSTELKAFHYAGSLRAFWKYDVVNSMDSSDKMSKLVKFQRDDKPR